MSSFVGNGLISGPLPLQGRAKQTYTSLTVHLLRRFTHTYTQAHTHTHTYLYMVIYRYLELHSMSFLVLRGKHEARWKWRSWTKNTTREVYRKLAPKCVFGKCLVQPKLRLSRRKTPGWSSRCIHIYIITYHIIHVYIYIYRAQGNTVRIAHGPRAKSLCSFLLPR